MSKNTLIGILAAVGILAGVAAYFYWRPSAVPAPPPPPPVATVPVPAAPVPSAEPRAAFPVPEAPAEVKPLPSLADSDSVVQDALTNLYGRESLVRFFQLDGIARRFVATVDNLPRQSASLRLMPAKPVPGTFLVANKQDHAEINPDNYLRYRPYVQLMEAVEAKRLVATYIRFYPLFQSAYRDLGYPNGYFNDRLVAAIDDLLATPDVPAPKLVQPKVLYEFADPELEARSAGQKIMIRMGSGNAARVKDKLRTIRRELVDRH